LAKRCVKIILRETVCSFNPTLTNAPVDLRVYRGETSSPLTHGEIWGRSGCGN